MNDAVTTESDHTLRLYEATLRAIAERIEEPGSSLIASASLAYVEAERPGSRSS